MMPSFDESLRLIKSYAVLALAGWNYSCADSYLFEIGRQCRGVNRVAVVLRCDVHSSSSSIQARYVVCAIPVLIHCSASKNKLQSTRYVP